MNFKLGNNLTTWNLVIALGMIFILAIGAFDLFVSKPSADAQRKKYAEEKREAQLSLKENREKLAKAEKALKDYSYKGDPETVTPQVLALVTSLAKNKNVTIKSFRPQKPDNIEDLTRLKYVVLIEGSFKDVVSFIKTADEPQNLFSVSSFQAASADGETDKVNATVSLVAFALPIQEPGATTRG